MGIGPLIAAAGLLLLARLSADPELPGRRAAGAAAVRPRALDDGGAADHHGARLGRGAPRRRRLRGQQRGRQGRRGARDRGARGGDLGPVLVRARRAGRRQARGAGAASAIEAAKEQPLSGGDVSGVPRAEAAALDSAIEDSSESAFHLGMLLGAVLMALGGVISLLCGPQPGAASPSARPVRGPGSAATAGECGRCARVTARPSPSPSRPRRAPERRAPTAAARSPLDSSRVRIFSGIQPTGRKHLGNYIGAIRQYVDGQDRVADGESIYCIVDLHAISVAYDPAELRERVYDTTAILVAAGLDPGALHPLPPVRRPRAHRAHLAALGGHRPRRPQPDDPVQGEVGEAARAGLGRALPLSGPAGGRRARLQGRRGAGRRRPAPARRADARDRPALQRALRAGVADPGRARAPDPRGRRPGHGPPGPDDEDVDHGRHRAGHGAGARRGEGAAKEGDERGHRLRLRGQARRRARRGSRT